MQDKARKMVPGDSVPVVDQDLGGKCWHKSCPCGPNYPLIKGVSHR